MSDRPLIGNPAVALAIDCPGCDGPACAHCNGRGRVVREIPWAVFMRQTTRDITAALEASGRLVLPPGSVLPCGVYEDRYTLTESGRAVQDGAAPDAARPLETDCPRCGGSLMPRKQGGTYCPACNKAARLSGIQASKAARAADLPLPAVLPTDPPPPCPDCMEAMTYSRNRNGFWCRPCHFRRLGQLGGFGDKARAQEAGRKGGTVTQAKAHEAEPVSVSADTPPAPGLPPPCIDWSGATRLRVSDVAAVVMVEMQCERGERWPNGFDLVQTFWRGQQRKQAVQPDSDPYAVVLARVRPDGQGGWAVIAPTEAE